MNANRDRLQLLVSLFDLSVADVAKETGLSRPLVSRYLNGDDRINPRTLIARMEANLPKIIERRRRAYFQVDAVPTAIVESALATVNTKTDPVATSTEKAA